MAAAVASSKKNLPTQIVAVCTGNTCRSPMLMCFIAAQLKAAGLNDVAVSSCGVGVSRPGGSATAHAITIIGELKIAGVSLDSHASRHFTDLYEKELSTKQPAFGGSSASPPVSVAKPTVQYVVMSAAHREWLEQAGVPTSQISIVNEATGGVPDPYGGSIEQYRKTAEVMKAFATEYVAKLTA